MSLWAIQNCKQMLSVYFLHTYTGLEVMKFYPYSFSTKCPVCSMCCFRPAVDGRNPAPSNMYVWNHVNNGIFTKIHQQYQQGTLSPQLRLPYQDCIRLPSRSPSLHPQWPFVLCCADWLYSSISTSLENVHPPHHWQIWENMLRYTFERKF